VFKNESQDLVEMFLVERDTRLITSYDASKRGSTTNVMKLLTQDGLSVNNRLLYRDTALTCAARYGNSAVVKLCLEMENVDFNSQSYDGSTVISYAAWNGYKAIIKLLVKKGRN
jgi:ankyrin repeat protein